MGSSAQRRCRGREEAGFTQSFSLLGEGGHGGEAGLESCGQPRPAPISQVSLGEDQPPQAHLEDHVLCKGPLGCTTMMGLMEGRPQPMRVNVVTHVTCFFSVLGIELGDPQLWF